eukprot:233401_1
MSSGSKKFRMIHVHFGDQIVQVKMQKSVKKWKGNRKIFKRLLISIKTELQLKTPFQIYDPNDEMFIDDIDDLCGCYIGHEDDYNMVLLLHVKVSHKQVVTPSASNIIKTKERQSEQTLGEQKTEMQMFINDVLSYLILSYLSQWFKSYPFQPNDAHRHNFLFGVDCIAIIKSYIPKSYILNGRKLFRMDDMNSIEKSKTLFGIEYSYKGSDSTYKEISWELVLFTEDNTCRFHWTGHMNSEFEIIEYQFGEGTFVIIGDHVEITYKSYDGTRRTQFKLDTLAQATKSSSHMSGYGLSFKYLFCLMNILNIGS